METYAEISFVVLLTLNCDIQTLLDLQDNSHTGQPYFRRTFILRVWAVHPVDNAQDQTL